MKSVYAIATLSGTIIGAGLFALPYLALQLGFWVILIYFLVLGGMIILIHVFFGELALKTPDFKRLPGFAKIYLGKRGRAVAYVSTICGLFGAILAYLILGGDFLMQLISPGAENPLPYAALYFIIGAVLIFCGIKAIEKVEFWGLVLFLSILLVIFFYGRPLISTGNLFQTPDRSFLFLPYGIILFSLWGVALVPEIEEMLGDQKKKLLKIIPIAILIPALIYLFFVYIALGIMGENTPEDALSGLRIFLGARMGSLALFFGLLTTFTSFVALGLTLKKVFWYDLKFSKKKAWFITCFIPLSLYLIGFRNFINVIFFVGAVMLAIDGVLILLMYRKSCVGGRAAKIKRLAVYPLLLVLLGGIFYAIAEFIYHIFGFNIFTFLGRIIMI